MAPVSVAGRRRLVLAIVVALVAVATIAAFLWPSGTGSAQAGPNFEYAAKYICVNEVGPPGSLVANQGSGITYRTVINVHNPSLQTTAQIGKKAAGALTERSPEAGKISPIRALQLVPDQVLAIDCKDVAALLGGAQPNGDGMVVVYSSISLDVWAVYTMRGTLKDAGGATIGINGNIDVVHVPERSLAVG